MVVYCSKKCQKSNWKAHRRACKAFVEMSSIKVPKNNSKSINEARRDLEEARKAVIRLQNEANEAKSKVDREKRGEPERGLERSDS